VNVPACQLQGGDGKVLSFVWVKVLLKTLLNMLLSARVCRCREPICKFMERW
jgi:hypothetical protein